MEWLNDKEVVWFVKRVVMVVGVCGDFSEIECVIKFFGYFFCVGLVFFVEVDECYV